MVKYILLTAGLVKTECSSVIQNSSLFSTPTRSMRGFFCVLSCENLAGIPRDKTHESMRALSWLGSPWSFLSLNLFHTEPLGSY